MAERASDSEMRMEWKKDEVGYRYVTVCAEKDISEILPVRLAVLSDLRMKETGEGCDTRTKLYQKNQREEEVHVSGRELITVRQERQLEVSNEESKVMVFTTLGVSVRSGYITRG